jgi:hypothetical protein
VTLAIAAPEIVGAWFALGGVGEGVTGTAVAGELEDASLPPPPLLQPVNAALRQSAKVNVVSTERARFR